MTEKERQLIRRLHQVFSLLTEREQDNLLWFAEGLAFHVEPPAS